MKLTICPQCMLWYCTSSSGQYFKDLLHSYHVWQRPGRTYKVQIIIWVCGSGTWKSTSPPTSTAAETSSAQLVRRFCTQLHGACEMVLITVIWSFQRQASCFDLARLLLGWGVVGGCCGVGVKRSLRICQGLFGLCHALQCSPEVFRLPVRLLSKFNSSQSKCRVTN